MGQLDTNPFFASIDTLDMEDYVVLDYYFECSQPPEVAAAHLCQEQSTAQWKRVGVDEDLRGLHGAKVTELTVERLLDAPSFPSLADEQGRVYACRAKIAHPHKNFGPKIPNFLTAACGEGTFYTAGISAIKLLDVQFPESYLHNFDGPGFGVEGLREMLGVRERPIFLGVIKPNLGLSPDDTAALAFEAWLGGLDIAKDDEMLGDTEWSPLSERADKVGRLRRKAEETTGVGKVYLANVTDEVDKLIELHDIAVERGANALLVNSMAVGLSGVRMLRKHSRVPLVGHFAFIAPFTQLPNYGVHSRVFTKLQRLVGCDAIMFPGFGRRMKTTAEDVRVNVEDCLGAFGGFPRSLPIPAGSQWAGSAKVLYDELKTVDFAVAVGRAVFDHPMGPKAGAASLRQGWEAVEKGVTLEQYGRDHVELREALRVFPG